MFQKNIPIKEMVIYAIYSNCLADNFKEISIECQQNTQKLSRTDATKHMWL